MNEGPGLLSLCRIVGLHAEVKAEQEIVEVQAYAEAVGCCELFAEILEAEESSRLVGIVADRPYVAYVDEGSEFYDPEEL